MNGSVQNKAASVVAGILLPAEWDKNGSVTGLLIASFDDQNYHLVCSEIPAEWHDYLTKSVTVKGPILSTHGRNRILVHSLDPL
ncbi:MAG: hypothetical protein PVJ84_11695 [Desulfobacteraceae bacterium]